LVNGKFSLDLKDAAVELRKGEKKVDYQYVMPSQKDTITRGVIVDKRGRY